MSSRYNFPRPKPEPTPIGPWGPRLPLRSRLHNFAACVGVCLFFGLTWALLNLPRAKNYGHRSPADSGLPVYPKAYNFASGALDRGDLRGRGSFEWRYLYDVPGGNTEAIVEFYRRQLTVKGWNSVGDVISEDGKGRRRLLRFHSDRSNRLLELRVFTMPSSPHVVKVSLSLPSSGWD